MDAREFRSRLLLRLATSPLTLLPALVGSTLLVAGWAVGTTSGTMPFAGVACLLAGLGVFATRAVVGSDAAAQAVVASMQHDAAAERERRLDELDRRLVASDDDPRPEACLRDLRALAKTFEQYRDPGAAGGAQYTLDIALGVEQLFERCVRTLEQTMDLWQTASRMSTTEASQPVLARREQMIDDVRASVRQLGDVLVGLQALGVSGEGTGEDLARLRHELDDRLAVARRVEERMRSLDRQLDGGVPPDGEGPTAAVK